MPIYRCGKPEFDFRAACPKCAMTPEQRREYHGRCPLNYPELGCPFYDEQEMKDAYASSSEN